MKQNEPWKFEEAPRPAEDKPETVSWVEQALVAVLIASKKGLAIKVPYERPTLYPRVHYRLKEAFEGSPLRHDWKLRMKAEEGFMFAWLERPSRQDD